jgi:hypothetical protein
MIYRLRPALASSDRQRDGSALRFGETVGITVGPRVESEGRRDLAHVCRRMSRAATLFLEVLAAVGTP